MIARAPLTAFAVVASTFVAAVATEAQTRPTLQIEREDGSSTTVSVSLERGYAVVGAQVLEELGWMIERDQGAVTFRAAGEIAVAMRLGSPYFRWDGVVLQLADAPFVAGGQLFVPLQFLTDFLPRRLPGLYDFVAGRSLLRAGDVALLSARGAAGGTSGTPAVVDPPSAIEPPSPADPIPPVDVPPVETEPSPYDGVRVVVIDAGHGGEDPGAMGPDGIREKAVALGIALRLEAALRDVPELEVHMIRDDDTFVDLWERGLIATDLKGDRPGIFVSIHANSFPARREASGFETYFLSDARTEHERRVSAIENAPIGMGGPAGDEETTEDLDFILRDLKNYDHAHWSENLAGLVQEELDDFHPGPNRGVKQAVLAVLTNALMPSVLVEVGYLSNDEEARLLGEPDFHQNAATAIAESVVRFFERYPPGAGIGGSPEER